MVSIDYVISLVQNKFECKDVTIDTRARPYPYYRYVAYTLCREFTQGKKSLQLIGNKFNRDHATVINGIKQFEKFKNQNWFKEYFDVYTDCYTQLKKETRTFPEHNELRTAKEVEMIYRLKHIKLTEKTHEVIGSLTTKLHNLRHRQIFKEIASLDNETLDLFEDRVKAFLIMNKRKV